MAKESKTVCVSCIIDQKGRKDLLVDCFAGCLAASCEDTYSQENHRQ